MTTPRPTIRRVFMLTLAVLVTIAPLPATEVADEGTFEANWSLEGTQESVVLAGKSVAAYRLTGKVKVRVSDGLATEFASICAGISDQETGGMARCIWTDGEGAEIYLQLTGKIIGSMGTSRETQGKITGGTGRYEGLEGWVDTDWLFWESAFEEGKITARDTKTRGGWRRP